MKDNKHFFAVDLGATSGRTIIGTLQEDNIQLEELTRFDNNLIETGNHVYWDIYALYGEIIKGLKLAKQRNIKINSIGIDTWGVDFICVGKDGALLGNPIAYRGPHTIGMMEDYFEHALDKQTVYDATGIQFMNFNSLFQLYAMRKNNSSALDAADKILFVPDALRAVTSTDAMTADWAHLPYQFLAKVSNDIINKVKGVNRVCYDISSKPPSTIEWE